MFCLTSCKPPGGSATAIYLGSSWSRSRSSLWRHNLDEVLVLIDARYIANNLSLTSVQVGLLESSSLIGMFIGGIVFGPVTDELGRQSRHVLNLLTFPVGSLASFITKTSCRCLSCG
ncbi:MULTISPECIES: MFS transporter [Paraburkholderia]|uniref:MFS transporter n=1 Tax=Paraburkholderia nemoris TaxID=2793076 RepID=UPI00190B7391|nr:MFS transporter [Paraburkholderia aspalathi]